MKRQRPVIVALALVAGWAFASAAQAHGSPDVRWSVTIGTPALVLPRVVLSPPPLPHVRVQPVVVTQPVRRDRSRWDADGDGIPNRYDRIYNPRWDVDGDGIPNRYDRVYNPRWDVDGDGIPNRYDRHPTRPDHGRGPGYDRDRDGVPDRRDAHPREPRRGR